MNPKNSIANLLSISLFFLLGSVLFLQTSCSREIEVFDSEALSDYIPLQSGKYITYRVDSTVFTNFGTTEEIHSYQVKHVIDAQITDNLGRPSYRVFRYISDRNDTLGTPAVWHPDGSYFITPLNKQVEVIEDNMRIIKMHLPIKEGYTWKGNKYLFTGACNNALGPYCSIYTFSNDDAMTDWDFNFDRFENAVSYRGHTYSDVYTIEQVNDPFNVPITNPNAYAYISRSVEQYAKNIGMVYREYTLWEYQPNPGGSGPYKIGFGVKMWMVDHN